MDANHDAPEEGPVGLTGNPATGVEIGESQVLVYHIDVVILVIINGAMDCIIMLSRLCYADLRRLGVCTFVITKGGLLLAANLDTSIRPI